MMDLIFNHSFILAQICGAIALAFSALAWQMKNSRIIILLYIPCCFFYMVQDFLLGAFVGALISFVNIFKNVVLFKYGQKYAKQIIIIFVITATAGSMNFIENFIDTLPVLAVIISSFSYLNPDNRFVISRGNLLCQIFYIIYSLHYGAYIGVLASLIVTISNVSGMVRHENWQIGNCYRTFLPSLGRALCNFTPRTYP